MSISLGNVLRSIRERHGLNIEQMALQLNMDSTRLGKMERDKVRCLQREVAAYEQFSPSPWEAEQMERLFVPSARDCGSIGCKDCSAHDGEMRPNGKLGARDEFCTNIDGCLNRFIVRWTNAPRSHCPPNCTRREHEERAHIISIGSTLHAVR